jgi:hypothetical protein
MKNSPKFVTSYRADFTTPGGVECTLKSESLTELQKEISAHAPDNSIRLASNQGEKSQSIYINEEWAGFVTQLEVPAHLTVRVRNEQRQAIQKAA